MRSLIPAAEAGEAGEAGGAGVKTKRTKKAVIVHGEGWAGLYVAGKLRVEGVRLYLWDNPAPISTAPKPNIEKKVRSAT